MFRNEPVFLYIFFIMIFGKDLTHLIAGSVSMKSVSSVNITDVVKEFSFHCSPEFLVVQSDDILFIAEVFGSNPVYVLHGPQRPQFYILTTAGHKEEICSPFHQLTGACLADPANLVCFCRPVQRNGFQLTFHVMVKFKHSKAKVILEWGNSKSELNIPQVRPGCPLKLLNFNSTHSCSPDFLVSGEDRTTLQFLLSGWDPQYTNEAGHAAHIYQDDEGGSYLLCGGFNHDCSMRGFHPCTCERVTDNVYIITFNSTLNSGGALHLGWPGIYSEMGVISHFYPLPPFKRYCHKHALELSLAHIAAIVLLILMAIGFVVFCCIFGQMRESGNTFEKDAPTTPRRTAGKFNPMHSVPTIEIEPPSGTPSEADSMMSIRTFDSEAMTNTGSVTSTTSTADSAIRREQ